MSDLPLLLSPMPFTDYIPETFKAHVMSLYQLRRPKKAVKKVKRLRDYKIITRLLKNGSVSLNTKRPMKYLTHEELRAVEVTAGRAASEIFILVIERGFTVFATHEEAERVWREAAELEKVFSGETL